MAQRREEVATLGGGCFWCLEAIFDQVRGVTKVEPGYSGGHDPRPTYERVCSGATGHAEVVQITYDPDQISFRELLHIFFRIHDPTTLNRQGADVGTQYRSIILYHDAEQKAAAEEVIRELTEARVYPRPIVTQVVPFEAFYPAEEYHHDYYRNHPYQAYCQFVIAPKLSRFQQEFADRLKG